MRLSRTAILSVAALGCTMVGELKGLVTLQRRLAAEYHTNAISVNINNAVHLTVTFANSPMGQLPEDEREGAARGVATFVLGHYPRADTLRTITVAFSSRTSAGPLTITRGAVPLGAPDGQVATSAQEASPGPTPPGGAS